MVNVEPPVVRLVEPAARAHAPLHRIQPHPHRFGNVAPIRLGAALGRPLLVDLHRLQVLLQQRHIGQVAGQAMAHLYQAVRWCVNFFQPSFKLIEKFRDGATTVKRYSPPAALLDRLIGHDTTGDELKAGLNEYRSGLDPVQLLHSVREAQSALVVTTAPAVRETPNGESLEGLLAKLPSLWRQGEVRLTHMVKVRASRHWRTRKDPFEGVWTDVLAWLQAEPDATGKALMGRLQSEHPDRFSEAQLRTMQRRLKEWRCIMAKELVYAGTAAASTAPSGLPEMALAGTDRRC